MNTDPSDPAKNSKDTVALYQVENDPKTGTLSGRQIVPICPTDFAPDFLTKPPNMSLKFWFKKLFPKTQTQKQKKPKHDEP